MSKLIVFVQVQGTPGLTEVELKEATRESLDEALAAKGLKGEGDDSVFLDEGEEPLNDEGKIEGLKAGARVHVTRCRKIKVTVHFLEKAADKTFGPGARVRRVKAWATRQFKLEEQDAVEHVMQLCNSTERPKTDTPLHELTDGKTCSVCFDLVPEIRVEG
ncbi:MAG: hypothetical protein Q7U20_07765 [Caulobacter sp.]|nr:hypothetical protein [Caulobacter sp.]